MARRDGSIQPMTMPFLLTTLPLSSLNPSTVPEEPTMTGVYGIAPLTMPSEPKTSPDALNEPSSSPVVTETILPSMS